jgi:hypothetical protein
MYPAGVPPRELAEKGDDGEWKLFHPRYIRAPSRPLNGRLLV